MAGVVRSSNTQGNPLHDAETGEFTDGNGKAKAKAGKSSKSAKGKKGIPTFKKKAKPQLKMAEGLSFDDLFSQLEVLNQSAEVELLPLDEEKGWQPIIDNIERIITPKCVEHIDKLYGSTTDSWSNPWQFHPKAAPNVNLNLFTCVLGKYRYQDNHARIVGVTDFNLMAQDTQKYTKVYRGFSSTGDKRKAIINSYASADINNFDYYGNGCYGTNIYTSTTYDYSLSYANRDPARVMHCLVDNDAKTIRSGQLEKFVRAHPFMEYKHNPENGKYEYLPTEEGKVMVDKIKQHFINNGVTEERAASIAKHFAEQLHNDISLLATVCGYDYQISDSGTQRNILNLKKWIIRREF